MSNKKPDGGPAFPRPAYHKRYTTKDGLDIEEPHISQVPGMSLRDWFRGMAMLGLIAGRGNRPPGRWVASEADELADWMMEEG